MKNTSGKTVKVDIRPMVIADLDEVTGYESEIFEDPWPRQSFEEALSEPSWACLVAEADDLMVAYACYQVIGIEGHLTNIAVVPEYRRKTVAQQLLETILEIVQERQCQYLLLEVRPRNKAAVAFYERHGFELMCLWPNYYRNPVEDALVMVRYLAPDRQDD